jgi:asparagine synthase (glutamine-hydrolysing)
MPYARMPAPLRSAIRRVVEGWPPSEKKVTLSFLLKRFVAGADLGGVEDTCSGLQTYPRTSSLVSALRPPARLVSEEEEILDNLNESISDVARRGLLTKADRASMRSALELRAPFLDRSVMEYAASIPARERVNGVTTKVFLKRYAELYLPARSCVVKRDSPVPLARWLREIHPWAADRLAGGRLAEAGVDADGAILEEHRRRRADHARSLWTLLVLTEWLDWIRGERRTITES